MCVRYMRVYLNEDEEEEEKESEREREREGKHVGASNFRERSHDRCF